MPTKAKKIREVRRIMRRKFIRVLAEVLTSHTESGSQILGALSAAIPIKNFGDLDEVERQLEDFLSCRSETLHKLQLVRD